MNIASYVIVFIANFFSAARIFGLGWSVGPPSFFREAGITALITIVAGSLASISDKAEWKIVALCSAFGPALVISLMAQGILENKAFHLFHWRLIPSGGAVLSVLSFIISKKLFNRKR